MKKEELKTGFWGYKKFSVYQYITALEQEFSAKLLAQSEEHRNLLEQERQRVQQLEEELRTLRQQYEAYRSEQMLIANTLVEAQRYAEMLKAESEERKQEAAQQLEKEVARQNQELERHAANLNRLREQVRSLLQDMDGSAERLATEVENMQTDLSDRNMSLFCRKSEVAV